MRTVHLLRCLDERCWDIAEHISHVGIGAKYIIFTPYVLVFFHDYTHMFHYFLPNPFKHIQQKIKLFIIYTIICRISNEHIFMRTISFDFEYYLSKFPHFTPYTNNIYILKFITTQFHNHVPLLPNLQNFQTPFIVWFFFGKSTTKLQTLYWWCNILIHFPQKLLYEFHTTHYTQYDYASPTSFNLPKEHAPHVQLPPQHVLPTVPTATCP